MRYKFIPAYLYNYNELMEDKELLIDIRNMDTDTTVGYLSKDYKATGQLDQALTSKVKDLGSVELLVFQLNSAFLKLGDISDAKRDREIKKVANRFFKKPEK